ncbi:GNAT family N-acetyltransferase [Halosolutus amylolyticus]|uniref:GNAT family N-acetyltransferase n=1 Tax=Halosolutus amylolyticus TaxID=2932267 RepID=A0ABD5PST2_9EURY|nr:GNAT family protein [Halosolutus amylolyticus]
MPGHVFLEGDRVVLSVVERADPDLAALGHARNDPAFRRALGFDTPWSRDRVAEFLDSAANDESSINLLVCLAPDLERGNGPASDEPTAADPEILGAVNLFDVDRHTGTLSYWLYDAYQGEGYATEAVSAVVEYAFAELGLHRVEARAFAENDRSRALLDRLGFVHEGTERECDFANGEYRNVERYGLLEDEWDGPGWE